MSSSLEALGGISTEVPKTVGWIDFIIFISMVLRVILIQLVVALTLAAVSSPTWATSSNIKTGRRLRRFRIPYIRVNSIDGHHLLRWQLPISLYDVELPLHPRYSFTYPGIIDSKLSTATGNFSSNNLDWNTTGSTGYQFFLKLYDGTAVNSWGSSYSCYDWSLITLITSAKSSKGYTSSDAIRVGSGYRY